ncbi:MAG: LacI family DNA-binding transcriptional regulator [Clostridiales bacterium]|nr:LacI family DNA-binding transcriptional regulator [Clostridiales bacterium]
MATMKDIAERLGVSVSTVSKSLNGTGNVSESVRQQILDTALEMGYASRRDSRARTSAKICVFIENMGFERIEHFGYEIIVGFRLAATERDWKVDIVPISMGEKIDYVYDEYMRKNGYDGGFLLGFFLHSDFHRQLKDTLVPTVLLDNLIVNPKVACIGVDNYQGVTCAVEHLASLGHSSIALMNGDRNSRVSQERYQGFRVGMNKCNLPIQKNSVAYGDFSSDNHTETFVNTFIESGATAIVCASDYIAVGVLSALARLDLRVPRDISVTGFDDIPIARYSSPPLTTIRQDRLNIGKSACVALEQIMEGMAISRFLLKPELIVRESTGPVR